MTTLCGLDQCCAQNEKGTLVDQRSFATSFDSVAPNVVDLAAVQVGFSASKATSPSAASTENPAAPEAPAPPPAETSPLEAQTVRDIEMGAPPAPSVSFAVAAGSSKSDLDNSIAGGAVAVPAVSFAVAAGSSKSVDGSAREGCALQRAAFSSSEFEGGEYTGADGHYPGYGCSIPPGPKRYSENLVTPEAGSCLRWKGQRGCQVLLPVLRIVGTFGVAAVVLGALAYTYIKGQLLIRDAHYLFGFGMYGAILLAHVCLQATFAALEHRQMRLLAEANRATTDAAEGMATHVVQEMTDVKGSPFASSVAIQISAFEEDPDYLRECLQSIKNLQYPKSNLKILLCVDGNAQKDVYHWTIFKQIFHDEQPRLFRWDYNYHELPEGVGNDKNGVDDLKELVQSSRCICLMQKWGGKREVMYSGFKTLGDSVDYIQVCDSDTKLDTKATLELVKVLDACPKVGAVGGDVKILNDGDSLISFLSSLRYWMAFNIERACQSYFNCVSCISGPLGLYRNCVLQSFLDLWSDQKFLGSVCTFGDDRHLTNRMLQMGFATKYTARSVCWTETPSGYLRWLNQQIRWSKSYFREWLFNSLWWHKHSLWMTYESIVAGAFPYFICGTVIKIFWSGDLWEIILVLCLVQFSGLLKGIFASCLRRDPIMLYLSMYGVMYMTSLLPAKFFAIATINKKAWGTSGRKTLLRNYNSLIPVTCWMAILLPGFGWSLVQDLKQYFESEDEEREDYDIKMLALLGGLVAYVLYWLVITISWRLCISDRLHKKADLIRKTHSFGTRTLASASWANSRLVQRTFDPTGTWKM